MTILHLLFFKYQGKKLILTLKVAVQPKRIFLQGKKSRKSYQLGSISILIFPASIL